MFVFQGVGVATMTVVAFLDVYYCVIIAWTFFYLFASYAAIPSLPWATCGEIPLTRCSSPAPARWMVEHRGLLQGIYEPNGEPNLEAQLHACPGPQQYHDTSGAVLGVSACT
jgi:hypothetical protein